MIYSAYKLNKQGDSIQPWYTPFPIWEICMQARKQQLELDMQQQTGSKLGEEYIKSV